jgi:AcrR family transcriptional regulator
VAVQPAKKARAPLTRERVLRAAVDLADDRGIEALTMRALGQELGVEAMSLYNHVKNKAEILNGIVDVVCEEIVAAVDEIPQPDDPADWKAVVRARILRARDVHLQHRWAPALIETLGDIPPSLFGYYEQLLATMREGGFSLDLAHHALHALGSRALGFAQELFMEADHDIDEDLMAMMLKQMAGRYPHMVDLMKIVVHDPESTLGGCDDQFEFEFGLDVILDGLDRLRDAGWHSPTHS